MKEQHSCPWTVILCNNSSSNSPPPPKIKFCIRFLWPVYICECLETPALKYENSRAWRGLGFGERVYTDTVPSSNPGSWTVWAAGVLFTFMYTEDDLIMNADESGICVQKSCLSVCERPVKSVTRTPVRQADPVQTGASRFLFSPRVLFSLFSSLSFSLCSSKLSCTSLY
jgi:hypothetical protein